MSGTVHLERIGRHVVLAELDNPPRNTLRAGMVGALQSALVAAEADHEVRAFVVTGRGPAFCAGADLNDERAATETPGGGEFRTGLGTLFASLERTRLPVIGLINGWCVGGGLELALCCDLRLASSEAKFVCAGVNVGLIASAYKLPRLIGVAAAKAMLLTGSPFDAEAALRFNLVTEIHAPDRLRAAGVALAERIASRAPLSVEASKRVADLALHLSPEDGGRMERREARALAQTEDHKGAVAAFLGKSAPTFVRR
ncbi:MAG: enoyl-CoA hydratase/isomerase family protein [Caulobacteraceae bacterium]|nr:enoyl-CoA hydratase/isomerase family protein [Caulobacteraceae bacterium]